MKATGQYEIWPDVWKKREFYDQLLWHCNAVNNKTTTERWAKGYILTFSLERRQRNCQNLTVISLAAKIYNALLLNRIDIEIEKIL